MLREPSQVSFVMPDLRHVMVLLVALAGSLLGLATVVSLRVLITVCSGKARLADCWLGTLMVDCAGEPVAIWLLTTWLRMDELLETGEVRVVMGAGIGSRLSTVRVPGMKLMT
jgi:hypothetical protein